MGGKIPIPAKAPNYAPVRSTWPGHFIAVLATSVSFAHSVGWSELARPRFFQTTAGKQHVTDFGSTALSSGGSVEASMTSGGKGFRPT